MNNVKDYRKDELKYYVFVNVLIIILLAGYFQNDVKICIFPSIEGIEPIITTGIIFSLTYTYIFILDAIIPASWKDKICSLYNFWGDSPGETVFDDINQGKLNDKRYPNEVARRRYAKVFQELANFNDCYWERKHRAYSIWYGLFVKHIDQPIVFITYRDYLLCRDLVVATALITVLYFVLSPMLPCFGYTLCSRGLIFLFLLFELILTGVVLRVKNRRLVQNVIAVDVHSSEGVASAESSSKEN